MKERPVWTLPMQRLSRLNRWLNDLAVLILLAGCCLPLHGAELPLERAFWIDASGSTSLDEALVQPLQPAPAVLSLGYTPAASWLRIWKLSASRFCRPKPTLFLLRCRRGMPASWRLNCAGAA